MRKTPQSAIGRWCERAVYVGVGSMVPTTARAAAAVGDVGWAFIGGGLALSLFVFLAYLSGQRRIRQLTEDLTALRSAHAESVREAGEAADRAKSASRTAKESERRFRDFAECASDWFWETDAEHRFTFLSGTAVWRLVEKQSEVLGKRRWDFSGTDDAESEFWQRHRMDLDAHRPIENFCYTMATPDGDVRHLRVDGVPVFGKYGDFLGYRGTARDITAQVETLESLKASEERYRTLIEGSLQGILINLDFKPVFVNQAYSDIFGYDSPAEIMALNSQLDLVAPEERDRLAGYRDARLSGEGAPRTYTFVGLRKNGSRVRVRNRVTVVDWEGRKGILSTVMDVAEDDEVGEAAEP